MDQETKIEIAQAQLETLQAAKDAASVVSRDSTRSLGELAAMVGVLARELRNQLGFDTTVLEQHLDSRITQLGETPDPEVPIRVVSIARKMLGGAEPAQMQ